MKILTSLQYKPLYNINHSKKWGKKKYKPRVIMTRVRYYNQRCLIFLKTLKRNTFLESTRFHEFRKQNPFKVPFWYEDIKNRSGRVVKSIYYTTNCVYSTILVEVQLMSVLTTELNLLERSGKGAVKLRLIKP